MEVRGRNLVTGLPETVEVSSVEIREALSGSVQVIIDTVRDALDEIPPEIVADLMDIGICLAGGGALLQGLADRLTEELKLRVWVAEDPLTCVARGAAAVYEDFENLEPAPGWPGTRQHPPPRSRLACPLRRNRGNGQSLPRPQQDESLVKPKKNEGSVLANHPDHYHLSRHGGCAGAGVRRLFPVGVRRPDRRAGRGTGLVRQQDAGHPGVHGGAGRPDRASRRAMRSLRHRSRSFKRR